MRPYQLPAGALLVTATDTPQTFQELAEAALGASIDDWPVDLSFVFMHPKTPAEDILMLLDGNDPDNSNDPKIGITIFENDLSTWKGMPVNKMKVQRAGSSNCDFVLQVGWTDAQGN